MGAHLIDGEFQSDKYPTCPRGKVPLSVKDKTAQDLLWLYAQRRRAVDEEFAADLEAALAIAGYKPPVGNVIDAAREIVCRVQWDGSDGPIPSTREIFIANGLLAIMHDSSLLMDLIAEERDRATANRVDMREALRNVLDAWDEDGASSSDWDDFQATIDAARAVLEASKP